MWRGLFLYFILGRSVFDLSLTLLFKGIVHPKIKIVIYSPSCHSRLWFIFETQIKIFYNETWEISVPPLKDHVGPTKTWFKNKKHSKQQVFWRDTIALCNLVFYSYLNIDQCMYIEYIKYGKHGTCLFLNCQHFDGMDGRFLLKCLHLCFEDVENSYGFTWG